MPTIELGALDQKPQTPFANGRLVIHTPDGEVRPSPQILPNHELHAATPTPTTGRSDPLRAILSSLKETERALLEIEALQSNPNFEQNPISKFLALNLGNDLLAYLIQSGIFTDKVVEDNKSIIDILLRAPTLPIFSDQSENLPNSPTTRDDAHLNTLKLILDAASRSGNSSDVEERTLIEQNPHGPTDIPTPEEKRMALTVPQSLKEPLNKLISLDTMPEGEREQLAKLLRSQIDAVQSMAPKIRSLLKASAELEINTLQSKTIPDLERDTNPGVQLETLSGNSGKITRSTSDGTTLLRDALRRLIKELPEFGSIRSQEIREAAESFISDLEADNSKSPFNPKQESIRLLSSLQGKNPNKAKDSPEFKLNSRLDPSTLKTLDTIGKAQDSLKNLAPALKALGEPTMILFPTIFQGLVSKFEVVIHPTYLNAGDLNSGKRHPASEDKIFKRISLRVSLPTLGEIEADIAYRRGEILVNILCRERAASATLSKRIAHLESAIKLLGFPIAQIKVAAQKAIEPLEY